VESPCLFETDALCYQSTIAAKARGVQVRAFSYSFDDAGHRFRFGMVAEETESAGAPLSYDLVVEGCSLERFRDRPAVLPTPVKSYGFPDQVQANYRNAGFLPQFVLAFEELFQEIYYLGPIRDYPQRIYDWTRVRPRDVGQRGEQAVQALLAAEQPWAVAEETSDYAVPSLEARVARWLRDLGLVESFHLERIGPSEDSYRVRVKVTVDSPEVSLADVGFGVSQFLPVLILCYYVPEGATIILEQPELHLHPSVQAGLADVFIDVIKHRNVQIILESHSEHLVHRLRRRIAEQALASEDVDLYFVEMAGSESRIERLAVDVYGNINNWPADFFGDRMGDLLAQTDAEMQRKVTKEPPQ
jgi:hypothetical protein